MKKRISLCLLTVMLFGLCACSQAKPQETIACGHEAYADLLARLEAKDYDGARSLIDAMEGKKLPAATEAMEVPGTMSIVPEETVTATQGTAITADVEIVELTKYTVRDYFEFEEQFVIADKSGCMQYITLKDEYKDRLISAEDVKLEIAYLLCEAHGKIDLKAEKFQSEYFDIISPEQETRTITLGNDGLAWISRMLYFNRKGCFPDYAMDVEILSGSGKLILAAE